MTPHNKFNQLHKENGFEVIMRIIRFKCNAQNASSEDDRAICGKEPSCKGQGIKGYTSRLSNIEFDSFLQNSVVIIESQRMEIN